MNSALVPEPSRLTRSARLTRCLFGPTLLAVAVIILPACDGASRLSVLSGTTMGTSYTIKTVGETPHDLQFKVDAELQRLTLIFSTYDPDSELSRFNRHPIGEPALISPDLATVLRISTDVYQLTGGAFDVTVAPLVNLWGFGAPGRSRSNIPAAEDIQALLDTVGFDAIVLNTTDHNTATRLRSVTLDLSGVAKGYAVDRIAALLAAEGISDYLVEIGGELKAHGSNDRGEGWLVAIESPGAASSQALSQSLPHYRKHCQSDCCSRWPALN